MNDILTLATDQIETKYQQCEQLLRAIHAGDGRLTYEAFAQCEQLMGWDATKTKFHFHRMGRVIRAEQAAGDKASRAKLMKNLEAAETELATTGAELEAKIAELQRELRALASKRTTLAKQLDGANRAVEVLTDDRQLPDHVFMAFSNKRGTLNETIRAELNTLKVDRDQITLLLSQTGDELVQTVKYYDQSLVTRNEWGRLQLTDDWPARRAELAEQLPALEAEIETLEAEYETERTKLEDLKGYYLK